MADWLFSCYMQKTFLVFTTTQNTVQGSRKVCILVEGRGEGESRESRLEGNVTNMMRVESDIPDH